MKTVEIRRIPTRCIGWVMGIWIDSAAIVDDMRGMNGASEIRWLWNNSVNDVIFFPFIWHVMVLKSQCFHNDACDVPISQSLLQSNFLIRILHKVLIQIFWPDEYHGDFVGRMLRKLDSVFFHMLG